MFIFVLSVIMAVITLIAGFLPLYITSKVDTKTMSQFGSGIILSAAFIIVIPEGFEQMGSDWSRLAGVAVVLGFLLMLVIDKYFSVQGDVKHNGGTDIPDMEPGLTSPGIAGISRSSDHDIPQLRNVRSWFSDLSVTTLGLTIHAAADGVALGATSGASSTNLGMLVFLSIIIHKAPAAFSLTSILLTNDGYTLSHVKRDIVMFSLAGPLTAIFLSMIIDLFSFTTDSTVFPGFCLAFSGGTFVYVACHVLIAHGNFQKEGFWRSMLLVSSGTVLPWMASFLPD
mgnify:FL=1